MAYFSNATEGDIYQAQYCNRCIHGQDKSDMCPVWELHLLYNYQTDEVFNILDILIPEVDGRNGECRMFKETDDGNYS